MPCSPEQLAANRRNALKSSGPKTEEGKARSRANGLKHSLTGQGVVIPPEDAEEVARRSEVLEAEMKPSSELSRILIGRVAALSVRLERSVRQEFAAVAEKVRNARADFDDARRSEVEHMLSWITAEPATYARRLRQSPEGVDAVIRALLDVKADLTDSDDRIWHHGHFERIENLVGRRTTDFPASPIKAVCRAAWGDFSLLSAVEGVGLVDRDRRAWARDRVAEYLDEEIARLQALRRSIDVEAIERDRLEASERALFDPSKEATLGRKYEAATERSLFRTLREIRETEVDQPETDANPDPEKIPVELGSSLQERTWSVPGRSQPIPKDSRTLISIGSDRLSDRPGRRRR
ncbi:hypothetical protein P12x_003728 [Tundrisphaera lichenicola]|uniref:hypothetical protein n=1 Tax=Tundrisphaera lichenicola TaxID=2029860 RepID=UPI003EBDE56D